MAILNAFPFFWAYLEPMTFLVTLMLGIFLFLKDRVRRDRFFGFIPTVIPVVFDPSEKTILLCHLNGGKDRWILPQGRIEGSIIESAQDVLSRELNLERMYKLLDSLYLGRLALREEGKSRLSRFMDPSEWTLVRRWRGKSYTALFVETKRSFAERELDGEFLYDEIRFVPFSEAWELLSKSPQKDKVSMYLKILAHLQLEEV